MNGAVNSPAGPPLEVRRDVAEWRLIKASESYEQVSRLVSRALKEGWPEHTLAHLHEVEARERRERSRRALELAELSG